MYDPTIFENLKVAFENHIYDLDNLERSINIVNRVDNMDFAVLAREFSIQFVLSGRPDITVEVILKATGNDLAGEILELPKAEPGCALSLRINKQMPDAPAKYKQIEQVIREMWEDEIQLTQTLSYQYGSATPDLLNTIEVTFMRKLTEENMGDIGEFLQHVLEMIEVLHRI